MLYTFDAKNSIWMLTLFNLQWNIFNRRWYIRREMHRMQSNKWSRLAQLPNNRIEYKECRKCSHECNRERTRVSLSLCVWCCLHEVRNATAVFVYVRFNLKCQFDWMTIFFCFVTRFVLILSHCMIFKNDLHLLKMQNRLKIWFYAFIVLSWAFKYRKVRHKHKDKGKHLTERNRNTHFVRYSNSNAMLIRWMIFTVCLVWI